jgi:hypothetical protein
MDSENSSNSPFLGSHLPITLLGIAFCLFFLTQLKEAGIEADGLENQKTATAKLQTTLTEQIKKNGKELEDRKAAVAQAEKIQEDFAAETKTVKERTTSAAQFEAMNRQVVELAKLIEQGKKNVELSQNVQNEFTEMMKEVDALRRLGDKDAELIMTSFGIQVNDPVKAEDKKTEEKKSEEKKPGTPN